MTRVRALEGLDPATYRRSILHADERIWGEKNCYIDVWIELLHALRLEPRAMLPFVLAIDFEGDQWTFFKPPHEELRSLYGIDVQELNVWRPLIEHVAQHLAAGKFISTEADAFWLPDALGTDYRSQHTKTTIIIEDLDDEAGTLGYFHNAAYFRLAGEDFRKLFRLDAAPDPAFLPLFAELMRVDRLVRHPASELASRSLHLLRRHFERRPGDNPVRRFQARFVCDLPALQAHGLAHYHAWAFATFRQLGAAFELGALHLEWLSDQSAGNFREAAVAFGGLASTVKTLILKVARAVSTRKPFDSSPLFDELARRWQEGMDATAAGLARTGFRGP